MLGRVATASFVYIFILHISSPPQYLYPYRVYVFYLLFTDLSSIQTTDRSRNPVTSDKNPAPVCSVMYSFQSERRLIYHTILYSFSVRYLLFGFTSFFFKYPYHEITKSANISNQCNHHHNNCIHRHSSYLLSIILQLRYLS